MKKTLLSILLGVSILTLAGCGNKETNTTNAPAQEVTENVVAEEVVGVIQNSGVQPTEEETVVEEETIGVPYGEVPDYAKNWTEADYGFFTDETAIVAATPGNWTTGVYTYNDNVFDMNKTVSELQESGVVFKDNANRHYIPNAYSEDVECGNGTFDVGVDYGPDAPVVEFEDAVFTSASANDSYTYGESVCGIILGDDFSKYMDDLGKPYSTYIDSGCQQYIYRSDAGYELTVSVTEYNITDITLSKVQE